MNLYRFLCVLMGSNESLWILMCPYCFFVSLCVPMGPSAFIFVLMGPYACLWVLMCRYRS